jgi:phosphoglycerol transferase MdoB-like AlkP superfamily enzyme
MAAAVCVMLLLSFAYRLAFLLHYGNYAEWREYAADVASGFFMGLRLDTQVALYFLLPLLLLAVLSGVSGRKLFTAIARSWSCTAVVIYSALLIGDFYYYQAFGSHYSISVFGIVDDDTQAVLKSMWTDFPTIRILLFFAALSTALVYLINRLYRYGIVRAFHATPAVRALRATPLRLQCWEPYLAGLMVPLIFILLRGSLGLFPLRNQDALISKNTIVNTVCLNPVLSLKEAYVVYDASRYSWDVNRMLQEAGYSSAAQLAADYLNMPVNSIQGDPLTYLQCTTKVAEFLSDNPPHVVFLQMEGMGLNGFHLQSDSFDILGVLKEELEHCVVFQHFLPYTTGNTVGSLEGLLITNVTGPVIYSAKEDQPVLSSVAWPFKKAGYETRFVTGANQGWRNINNFLPAQGFDRLEGKEAIRHDIPEAEVQEWGVFDEYLFAQIFRGLLHAGKPQFIYGMSITNHSPHQLPSHYTFGGISINDRLKERLLQNEEAAMKGFGTYRYANDCLGNFIRTIRNSPLADKVIIAATGDHSFKGMLKPDNEKWYDKFGVPFILYIPERYKPAQSIDAGRRGSHRDIFPTLFHLSLSGATYYHLGSNMLGGEPESSVALTPNNVLIAHDGAVDLSTGHYYTNHHDSTFTAGDNPDSAQALRRRYHLWKTASRYVTLRSFDR